MRQVWKGVLILLMAAVLSGCWDRVEVNRRSYIMGIGVDAYDAEEVVATGETKEGTPVFNFLFEISALKSQSDGKSGENIKVTIGANTISQALDLLETTVEYPAILTHLQAVVVSREVAQKGLVQVTDFLIRNPQVRRRTKIFIAEGKAADYFGFKPEISNTVGEYLNQIPTNSADTSMVLVKSDLGTLSYSLSNRIDFLLPKLLKKDKRISTEGAAVIDKDGKWVAWAEGEVFEGARLIRNLYGRGYVNCSCPITGRMVVVRIEKARAKVKTHEDFTVDLTVKVDGVIATNMGGRSYLTPKYLDAINHQVEDAIKSKIQKSLEYFQNRVKLDVFFFKMYYREHHYRIWKQNEKDWSNVFQGIKVNIKVSSDIEGMGSVSAVG